MQHYSSTPYEHFVWFWIRSFYLVVEETVIAFYDLEAQSERYHFVTDFLPK